MVACQAIFRKLAGIRESGIVWRQLTMTPSHWIIRHMIANRATVMHLITISPFAGRVEAVLR